MKVAILAGIVGAVATCAFLCMRDLRLAAEHPDFEVEYERNALVGLAIGGAIFAYALGANEGGES